MLNMAKSGNLDDDADGAGPRNIHLEIIAKFRALTARTELNSPCWPIRQLILSKKI